MTTSPTSQDYSMTTQTLKTTCSCGSTSWHYYDGMLGYESMKCDSCGIDVNDLEIDLSNENKRLKTALQDLMNQCVKDAQVYAQEGNEAIWAFIDDASDALNRKA